MASGSNISFLGYGYDNDDNLTRITDKVDASRSQNFGYDAVGRLSRVMLASGAVQRVDYVFDGNGNRVKRMSRALATDLPASAAVDRYSLKAGSNAVASITGPGGATDKRSMSYDARGNLTAESRPGGVTISGAYDGYARLTGYSNSAEASFTHVYNGLDDRVASTRLAANGVTTTRRFVYAPDGRVVGEYGANAADVKAEFIWLSPEAGANDNQPFGGDDGLDGFMPLAVAANDNAGMSTLTWVHANHMGVPLRYSNAAGTTLPAPANYSVPGFPGQSQTLADLYYNRYRDYDSSTGRYIQADPIGLAGGSNP